MSIIGSGGGSPYMSSGSPKLKFGSPSDYESTTINETKSYPRLSSKVIKTSIVDEHIIVLAKYPECPNYEGYKILVFKYSDYKSLDNKKLEPHFLDNSLIKARFRPTAEGWNMATCLCQNYSMFKAHLPSEELFNYDKLIK